MERAELERVRDWAVKKLTTGEEPPWSFYRHMQLREALDSILQGMAATQPMEASPQPASRSGVSLRLVETADRQDSAQCHLGQPETPQLPM